LTRTKAQPKKKSQQQGLQKEIIKTPLVDDILVSNPLPSDYKKAHQENHNGDQRREISTSGASSTPRNNEFLKIKDQEGLQGLKKYSSSTERKKKLQITLDDEKASEDSNRNIVEEEDAEEVYEREHELMDQTRFDFEERKGSPIISDRYFFEVSRATRKTTR